MKIINIPAVKQTYHPPSAPRPLPVMRPQRSYGPKYGVKPVVEPDPRATVFWEPDSTTNQNGKAHVSFYMSAIKSKYTVKVEGFDATDAIGDERVKINY